MSIIVSLRQVMINFWPQINLGFLHRFPASLTQKSMTSQESLTSTVLSFLKAVAHTKTWLRKISSCVLAMVPLKLLKAGQRQLTQSTTLSVMSTRPLKSQSKMKSTTADSLIPKSRKAVTKSPNQRTRKRPKSLQLSSKKLKKLSIQSAVIEKKNLRET